MSDGHEQLSERAARARAIARQIISDPQRTEEQPPSPEPRPRPRMKVPDDSPPPSSVIRKDLNYGKYKETRGDKVIKFCQTLRTPSGIETGQLVRLRDWQCNMIKAIYDPTDQFGMRRIREVCLTIGRKNGKRLALDTLLPTPDGWTTMGDVQLGDVLFDEKGKTCRVTYVSPILDNRLCYRLKFSNGEEVIADAEHNWQVYTRKWPGVGHGGITHVITTEQISKTLTRGSGPKIERNHRLHMPEPLQLPRADLLIDPYILGLWLGDGTSAKQQLTCGREDLEWLTGELLRNGYYGRVIDRGYRAPSVDLYFMAQGLGGVYPVTSTLSDQSLCYKLGKLGLLDNKHIPASYLRASFRQRRALLQGLMDTDGFVSKGGNNLTLSTTKQRLAEGYSELLSSLGIKYSCYMRSMQISGRPVPGISYEFQFFVHPDRFEVFRLPRKRDRVKGASTSTRSRTVQIVACERIDSVPTRCIEVDSPSHLYRFGATMLYTHNTTLGSMLVLAHLVGPEAIPNGEMYSAGFRRDQAAIIWRSAYQMIVQDDELSYYINWSRTQRFLECLQFGTVYRAISAEVRAKHGLNPCMVILDELAQFAADRELYDVFRTSFGAQEEPLLITMSTQAADDLAIMSQQIDYGRAVQDGTIDDDSFVLFDYSTPDYVDIYDERNWYAANPALGDFRSLEDMRKLAARAKLSPSARQTFCNLYLNQRVASAVGLFGKESWQLCAEKFEVESKVGQRCYIGLDLSDRLDLTALVCVFPDEEGEYFDILPFFWTPKDTLELRSKQMRIPYKDWVEMGLVFASEGPTIDTKDVVRFLKTLLEKYDVQAVCYDPWRIKLFKAVCENEGIEEGDITWIEHKQSYKDMSPTIDLLEDDVLGGKLRHGGNPVLTFNASSTRVMKDPQGNRRFDKIRSTGQIDGIVAMAMALAAAHASEGEGASVYERRGMLSLSAAGLQQKYPTTPAEPEKPRSQASIIANRLVEPQSERRADVYPWEREDDDF